MKALKLKIYQETAVYRNPVTMEIVETYPLPPVSTVLGLVHDVVNKKDLHNYKQRKTIKDLNISIQGEHDAIYRDFQRYKKFGDPKKSKERGKISSYPVIVNVLQGVELLLHIFHPDERMLQQIYEGFAVPPYYLYIGRAEDLLSISEISIVNVEMKQEHFKIKLPCYISEEDFLKHEIVKSIKGLMYKLPTYYTHKNYFVGKEKRRVRTFDYKTYYYIDGKGVSFKDEDDDEPCFLDSDGDLVWWTM